MFFKHIYDDSLAQGSYMIGCQKTGEALVIDPKRDIDTYLAIAQKKNLNISYITETHIHADFLSGSRELAEVTGADLYLSDEGGQGWQYEFPHHGLKDGDQLNVGNLSIEVLHTPGHTPESISFLLTDLPASDHPIMIFTGDFVFVGDIGRPDLLEETAGIAGTSKEGARQMFTSLKRFKSLPDYVQVWPGHGAGSACGKSLGAVPSSTIGYEKIQNWALQQDNETKFIDRLIEDQPEPPKYFAMMKKFNKVKRPLLTEVPHPPKLTKKQFLSAYQKGVTIIDARHKNEFAQGAIPDSLNIEGGKAFATWAGWVVNYQEQFILVADDNQIEDLTRKLMRIGLDNIFGYVSNIKELDLSLETSELIDYSEMKDQLEKTDVQIVDVRSSAEYKTNHIPGSENIFVGFLQDNLNKIDSQKQIIVHCKSGTRATIASSILRKHGFDKIKNYSAGMDNWQSNEQRSSQKKADF